MAWDFGGPAFLRCKDTDGLAEWRARRWDSFRARPPFISDVTESVGRTFRRHAEYLLRFRGDSEGGDPWGQHPDGLMLVIAPDVPPRVAFVHEDPLEYQGAERVTLGPVTQPDLGLLRAIAGFGPSGLPGLTQVGDEWRLRTPEEDVEFRALIAERAVAERTGPMVN